MSRIGRLNTCIFFACFILGLLLLAAHPQSRNEGDNINSFVESGGSSERLLKPRNHVRLMPLEAVLEQRSGKAQTVPKHQHAFLHLLPISKDMIVYSAYFDGRARNGRDNVTLFLISMNRTIWKNNWVVACGSGDAVVKDFKVRFLQESVLMHNWLGKRRFPYDQFALDCYNLAAVNGSNAFILYRTARGNELVVESLAPLFVPAPRVEPLPADSHNISVVTCSKAHDKRVAWLPEFIRYQKTLGVDHVHLSLLDTFIKDGGFRDHLALDPFVSRAIRQGYLSITVWNNWYLEEEFYVRGSIFQYLDCFYRFRGTYDYVFPLDSDDFFNPSIASKPALKDYIADYCWADYIGSCAFRWVFYYPEVCGLRGEVGEDGNVTSQLNPHKGVVEQIKSKSVHSTKAVVDFSFHDARCKDCLIPGYKVHPVRRKIAYVAHNRKYIDRDVSTFC